MRRRLSTPLAVAAALVSITAPAAAAGHKAPLGTLINAHHTSIGTILVNARGYALYGFGPDRKNKDNCAKVRECLVLWPAVTTKSKPRAGRGVNNRLLGTIRLPGGTLQVTYAGHPLYTYIQDRGPGDIRNINILQFGGPWPAVNPAGQLLDKAGHVVK